MTPLMFYLISLILFVGLMYKGRGYWAWVLAGVTILMGLIGQGVAIPLIRCFTYSLITLAVIFGVPLIRRTLISNIIMKLARKAIPTISETERVALEAGTTWFEGELFSGKPDWQKLKAFKAKKLTKAEKEFLAGPVEKLCGMLDDWQINQDRDLPPEVWQFLKKEKFFGMIIPKKFGGLGFSAIGHSAVITKITSKSVTVAVTVMVPNSLGPGELLLHYGTKKQKDYYLPRLADGREIPCFALTEPKAGSDATSITAEGVVTKGEWQGKETLGINLTFDKRYITLAPVATVVGLAFHLKDPKGLLGQEKELGITCALIPRDTKGLDIGNRHDPGTPFQNGPVRGKKVFIPLEYIIGGKDYAGQGWRMLMEALAAGRGISLPSLSVGAAEVATRAASAYSVVREQFGMPIGKFEGVGERLARTASKAYYMNACRLLTCGAIDAGEKPAVISAIAKAYLTEGMRSTLNDGMDILAGSAICRGPNNIFTRPYISIPIGITVEGANILTRSLIVFGQGAIRCHPFIQAEVNAIEAQDVNAFDKAFFGHLNHVFRNGARTLLLSLTGGRLAKVPNGPYKRYYQKLARLSAFFAFTADIGLITLGGGLKRMEYLSGRYADAFAYMFLATATLKRAEEEGAKANKAIVDYTVTDLLAKTEHALAEVLRNLPMRALAFKAQVKGFIWGRQNLAPTDKQTTRVVKDVLSAESGLRNALTADLATFTAKEPGMGYLEDAYAQLNATAALKAKLRKAMKSGVIDPAPTADLIASAKKEGVITAAEAKRLEKAEEAVIRVITVADYTPAAMKKLK